MKIFDHESNGLLKDLTRLHCMVISDGNPEHPRKRFRPDMVHEGAKELLEAVMSGEAICGHNIINHDVPAMEKVYPWFRLPRDKRKFVLDTLVLSRLIYSNIKNSDAGLMRKGVLPGKFFGKHSLRAWGYRLGELKGDYALHTEEDQAAWDEFNEEMMDYNEQDVVVTEKLLGRLLEKAYSEAAIELEHQVAWLMAQQERNGFPFDIPKAKELEVVLRGRAAVLDAKLRKVVPPIPGKVFVPKRDNKARGYLAGVPMQKYKDFNPNSRQQIEWIIRKYFNYLPDEWELFNFSDEDRQNKSPEELTQESTTGKVPLKIDDETFRYIKEDETAPQELRSLAEIFEEFLMVNKRLGQLADGKQAWLKCVAPDGKIHGSVNPNGAVTGRATHAGPNIAQVPKVGVPYGHECRELFTVPKGWVQVGVDASGLELRTLAHFLYPYDGGHYAELVVNGDVHTYNQKAAGLPTRDKAKTFIYAWLYGAGDAKIGAIVEGDKLVGKRLKARFLKEIPAVKEFRAAITNALVETTNRGKVTKWKRRYLKGLDGRLLYVRSLHSALNTLLQSAGALICKKWIVETERMLVEEKGLKHGWDGDFAFMAWVHDEFQAACRSVEIAEIVKETAQEAMRKTGEFFGFRVQLDTEGKIGKNWADCH